MTNKNEALQKKKIKFDGHLNFSKFNMVFLETLP